MMIPGITRTSFTCIPSYTSPATDLLHDDPLLSGVARLLAVAAESMTGTETGSGTGTGTGTVTTG